MHAAPLTIKLLALLFYLLTKRRADGEMCALRVSEVCFQVTNKIGSTELDL